MISLLAACVPIHAVKAPLSFAKLLALGIALSGLCWYLASVYTQLWNQRFRPTRTHHILCGAASLASLYFTLVFGSLGYTRDAAILSIRFWQTQIGWDSSWAGNTYAKAFQRVKASGKEDFSNVPGPGMAGSRIPTTTDESRFAAAETYANEACLHFASKRPFLSKVVWSSPGVPSQKILEDVRNFHKTNPNYPVERAIEIAATRIREGLDPQTPRVVHLARISVIIVFLLVQAIPFGLIGWAAYRDIKVTA